jgi:hypothetical protein
MDRIACEDLCQTVQLTQGENFMPSILDNFNEMLGGDAVGQIGKALHLGQLQVNRGMSIAGPLIVGSIARLTSSSSGMERFTNILNQVKSMPVTGRGDMMSGILNNLNEGAGGTTADMLQGLLGSGVNAISGTLNQKLGFNVRPIITAAVPMVVGAISKAMNSEQLDAQGAVQKLRNEHEAWQKDPDHARTNNLINEAYAAGEQGEALRKKFTDADWEKVRMAPVAATYLVGAASPSHGGGATDELKAAAASVDEVLKTASPTSVIGTAFGGGFTKAELDGLKQAKLTSESVLRTIQEARAAVAEKSPNDAQAFSELVMKVATNVANAAKEGGFLGMGGEQVSKQEQAALENIKRALSASAE